MEDPQFQKHRGRDGGVTDQLRISYLDCKDQLHTWRVAALSLRVSPSLGAGVGTGDGDPCDQRVQSSSTMPSSILETPMYLNQDVHLRLGDMRCLV